MSYCIRVRIGGIGYTKCSLSFEEAARVAANELDMARKMHQDVHEISIWKQKDGKEILYELEAGIV